MEVLTVNEIFYSIQGESTRAGQPCVFVRLTGCHLRCGYCDTEYAFHEGSRWSLDQITDEVTRLSPNGRLVEITGGEPLLQPNVHRLMARHCDAGYTVLLETSGACDISSCDQRVIRIMDLKTPGSGEADKNLWSNLVHLNDEDEIKFVLTDRADFDWARKVIFEYDLAAKVKAVLLSAAQQVAPGRELSGCATLNLTELAQWMLETDDWPMNVRLQMQLHKLIWDPMRRGV